MNYFRDYAFGLWLCLVSNVFLTLLCLLRPLSSFEYFVRRLTRVLLYNVRTFFLSYDTFPCSFSIPCRELVTGVLFSLKF